MTAETPDTRLTGHCLCWRPEPAELLTVRAGTLDADPRREAAWPNLGEREGTWHEIRDGLPQFAQSVRSDAPIAGVGEG